MRIAYFAFASSLLFACSTPNEPNEPNAPAPSASTPAPVAPTSTPTPSPAPVDTSTLPPQTIDGHAIAITTAPPYETSSMRVFTVVLSVGSDLTYDDLPAFEDVGVSNALVLAPDPSDCPLTTATAARSDDGVTLSLTGQEPLTTPLSQSGCAPWIAEVQTTGVAVKFYDTPYDGTNQTATVLLQVTSAPTSP